MTPLAPPAPRDLPLRDEPAGSRPAPVANSMREREDISRADASAARCFVDLDAARLAAILDCMARLAQAEIDLAFGRLRPIRIPEGLGASCRAKVAADWKDC